MQTCRLTSSIAEDAAPQVGLDPASIITIISALLPVLSNLMSLCGGKKPTTPTEYREFLTAKYDGGYPAGVLNPAIRETMRASRNSGNRLRRHDAETLATETLDQLRTAPDDVLQEAITACAAG